MQQPLYDYKNAYGRIQELRRKVILQKGGHSVEGLPEIVSEKETTKPLTKKKSNSQENN